MKRFLALLLCAASLLCLAACGTAGGSTEASVPGEEVTPVPGMTEFSKTPSVGLEYTINEDESSCTITGIGKCKDTFVYIGSQIDGLAVTAIGPSAFYGNKDIKGIKLAEGILSLGDYAFFECTALEELSLADTLITIGSYTFAGCGLLKTVTIPESVESVGAWAFYDCFGLEAVHITNLERWMLISFSGAYANPVQCAEMLYIDGELCREVTVPETILSIGSWAFAGCVSLERVTIHANVTAIASRAFAECEMLTSISYGGTQEQWKLVDKALNWNFHTGEITVEYTEVEA